MLLIYPCWMPQQTVSSYLEALDQPNLYSTSIGPIFVPGDKCDVILIFLGERG